LYERVGWAAASLHLAADDFLAAYPRPAMDESFLVRRPAGLVAALLNDDAERERFLGLVEAIAGALRAFVERGLDWGPIHGDLTLDNLHVTTDGEIVLYDFDSGGPGWRAADLPGWAAIYPEIPNAEAHARAFREGYESVRPIAPVNFEAAPIVFLAFEIWALEIELRNRVLAKGETATRAFLSAAIEELRAKLVRAELVTSL
jgi:Ser/Thr protein kinase RdoA (MazF antagonist)